MIGYIERTSEKLKPIFTGAAVSGLFVIFYDTGDQDYFRNVPDTVVFRTILELIMFQIQLNHVGY